MKKTIVLFFASALLFASCGNDNNVGADSVNAAHIDPANPPEMTFETPVYNFGTISQGQDVKYKFKFTNTGKSDLVIHSAKGSCGCTVPKSYPTHPINPGDSGEIDVRFASEGRMGEVEVKVTVLANTKNPKNFIKIVGNVVAPE
jgi:hypothetical protein